MTPYYEEDGITIYHGDCREILPALPKCDLVFTSPPYNLGKLSGAYAKGVNSYLSHDDEMPEEEYVVWQRSVLALCWDVLPEDGAIYYNHKQLQRGGVTLLPLRMVPEHLTLRQIIIWNRSVGFNWSPSHFCPRHEWILLLAKPDFRLTDRGASNAGDVWEFGTAESSSHPCPFPVELPLRAICSSDAKTVLDPFAGSGTTLVAAKNLGRKAIGIEIEEKYCEIAAKRLAQRVMEFA